MKHYRYLLFDADETLFDFPQSERLAIARTLEEHGIPCGEETISLYSRINHALWQRFNLGEIPREQIRRERFSRLLESLGYDPSPGPELDQYYANTLGSFGDVPDPFPSLHNGHCHQRLFRLPARQV